MAYTIHIDRAGPWLVIEYSGFIDEEQLVAARMEAVAMNEEGSIKDFILDFTETTGLALAAEGVQRIAEIDRARSGTLVNGRCAMISKREVVELGTSYLGAVSPLDLDFRVFNDRSAAEAWLRGELEQPPPSLPRSRRR